MRGFRRGSIAICARLSIWKTPTVSARQIMSKVAGSSGGIVGHREVERRGAARMQVEARGGAG